METRSLRLNLEHETNYNEYNSLVMMDHDNFALAYLGQNYHGYLKTFNFTQTATSMQPRSHRCDRQRQHTIAVTMNEPVYRTTAVVSFREGKILRFPFRRCLHLHPLHPPPSLSAGMSIPRNELSGQASGFEKVTVMPASGSSIYDASNNTASASYQLNNSAFLKATGSPVITQTTIDAFNTEITVNS